MMIEKIIKTMQQELNDIRNELSLCITRQMELQNQLEWLKEHKKEIKKGQK